MIRISFVTQCPLPSIALCLSVLLYTKPLLASTNIPKDYEQRYCKDLQLGWNFYCDDEQIRPQSNKEPAKTKGEAASSKPLTPQQQVAEIRENLERLHALTVLNPTEKNIYAYERFKLEQLDRVSKVTQATQRVYWKYPELDYSIKRPVSTIGKRVWLDERDAKIEKTIKTLSRNYGLVYFFSSTCPVCKQFSPLLRELTDRYHLNIRAVSTDGGAIPEFRGAKIDRGEAQALAVSVVPTVFLFNTKTKEFIPVGSGFMSESDIKKRIFLLTNVEVGDDY